MSWSSAFALLLCVNSLVSSKALIEKLGDESYHVRAAAHEEAVRSFDASHLPLLSKTIKENKDLEIVARCRRIREAVIEKEVYNLYPWPYIDGICTDPETGWNPLCVRVSSHGVPQSKKEKLIEAYYSTLLPYLERVYDIPDDSGYFYVNAETEDMIEDDVYGTRCAVFPYRYHDYRVATALLYHDMLLSGAQWKDVMALHKRLINMEIRVRLVKLTLPSNFVRSDECFLRRIEWSRSERRGR